MNKKKKIGILLIILFLFVGGSYLKVEILTVLYGNQFESLYNASGWVPHMTYFKVMSYSDDKADVYYADLEEEDETSNATFLYHFQRVDNRWQLDEWECIWAEMGTADKFIWPYYFH